MELGHVAHSTKELAQKAIQANKDHQTHLKVYTERLEDELATVDKLLASAEADLEEEPEMDVGGYVTIPGSSRPTGPVPFGDLLSMASPFHGDAAKRQRYLEYTEMHPMKPKELDALVEAVRTENHRRHAFEAQERGHHPFLAVNDDKYYDMNKEGLDWDRIAESVSSTSVRPRSARECKIRWLGDRHPDFNHSTWTQPELVQLRVLINQYSDEYVDWVAVAKTLGTNRTPTDCMRHGVPRRSHTWGPESDGRLLEALKVYGTDNWMLVARTVSEDATAAQCQNRFYRSLNPSLKRGNWTKEEDTQLGRAVAAYGKSWMDVASCIPGRNNEQCRDRWSDKLNPANAKWSDEDDRALLEAVETFGVEWNKVSEHLGDERTEEQCRFRFDTLSKRPEIGEATASGPSAGMGRFPARGKSKMTGSSSQSARPRHRPRVRKTNSNVELETAVEIEPINKNPRPKPKPRYKGKGKEVNREGEPPSTAEPGAEEEVFDDSTAATKQNGGEALADADSEEAFAATKKKLSKKRTPSSKDTEAGPAKKKRKTTRKTQSADVPAHHLRASQVAEVHEGDVNDGDLHWPQQPIDEGTASTVPTTPKRPRPGRPKNAQSPKSTPRRAQVLSIASSIEAAKTGVENGDPNLSNAKVGRSRRQIVAVEPTRKQPSRAAARQSMAQSTESALSSSSPVSRRR